MSETKQRYSLLDAIRGFAVINMVIYHLMYNICCVFGVSPGFPMTTPAIIWERFICCTFIIISGIAINFSQHGYRRGIIVSLCGIIVTVVTVIFIPEEAIFYGVLTFLGFAMLVTFADYFPILPWIFLFVFGFYLWRVIEQRGWDHYFTAKIPVLDFIGRHSLFIYMAHQPVLYGICYLVFMIL